MNLMLFFGQLLSSFMRLVLFVVLICFAPVTFGLGVSPAELDFKGNTGEVLCGKVVVSDFDGEVVVEDRWAVRGYSGRDFLSHDLDASDLGISVDYVEGEVCLAGEKSGVYHGLLLFRGEGENSGAGIWIAVDLIGADLISFEGMSAGVSEENNGTVLLLGAIFILLLCLALIWVVFR